MSEVPLADIDLPQEGAIAERDPERGVQRRREGAVFLFLTVVLFPLLSVALVGGYGFLVWIWQIFTGPPGL